MAKRLLQCSVRAVEAHPEGTVALLLGEFSHCTSPRRAAMLAVVLKKLVIAAPQRIGITGPFLTNVPGGNALEKLEVCQKVLHSLFSKHLFGDELRLELLPAGGVEPQRSPPVGSNRQFTTAMLVGQHDETLTSWLKRHRIQPDSGPNGKGQLLNSLQTAAMKGDAEAKYLLALVYSDGYGVSQDLSESLRLMQEAAEAGNSNAQSTLGVLFCIGHTVEKDAGLGEAWLRRAERQGNVVARDALLRLRRLGGG
jgi:hypothetical protein